jgi:preprotein translocase subunit SecE
VSEVKQENRFKRYFKETRAEVRKVHWPTRKEARSLTTVVLVITIAMTIFLGVIISPLLRPGWCCSLAEHAGHCGVAIVAVAGIVFAVVCAASNPGKNKQFHDQVHIEDEQNPPDGPPEVRRKACGRFRFADDEEDEEPISR